MNFFISKKGDLEVYAALLFSAHVNMGAKLFTRRMRFLRIFAICIILRLKFCITQL